MEITGDLKGTVKGLDSGDGIQIRVSYTVNDDEENFFSQEIHLQRRGEERRRKRRGEKRKKERVVSVGFLRLREVLGLVCLFKLEIV